MEKKELQILPNLKEGSQYYDNVSAYNMPSLNPVKTCKKGELPCAVCGSEDTTKVGLAKIGSNAGSCIIREFLCNSCNSYSVYEYECSSSELDKENDE